MKLRLFTCILVILLEGAVWAQLKTDNSTECRAQVKALKIQDLNKRNDLTILRAKVSNCTAKLVTADEWKDVYQALDRIDVALERQMNEALLTALTSQASLANQYNELIAEYNTLLSNHKRTMEAAQQAGSSWNSDSAGRLLQMIATDAADSAKIQPKPRLLCSSKEINGSTYVNCQ